jgi:hypothetical protein
MYPAIVSDPATCANHTMRANLGTITDVRILSDYRVGTDASSLRNAGQRGDDGRGMNPGGNRRTLDQYGRGFRESHFRLPVA